jgi:hypothetical protein
MDVKFVYSYYDVNKGWDDTNRGWHELIVKVEGPTKHMEIVQWLYEHVDKPENHCRWVYLSLLDNECISKIKFRYERDYIWARLKWS